jgi:hypothetical protein
MRLLGVRAKPDWRPAAPTPAEREAHGGLTAEPVETGKEVATSE